MSKDERLFGMLCHALSFCVYIFPAFGNIIGPLVIWILKKNEFAFVDRCGRESLNFQISFVIYAVAVTVLGFLTFGFGFFLFIPLGIFEVVCVIIASVKAYDGVDWRYPLTIRFL